MIRNRFHETAAAADDLRVTAGQLQNDIGDLNTYLRDTLSFWEGSANSEYWMSQNAWTTAGNNIAGLLNTFASRLDTANEQFAATENDIKNRVSLI